MLLSAESRSTKRVQFRLMADSDLGKTGAQKDDGGRTGGGREGGREGGDNPPCPRFNSFSTSRVPFPFGPLAAFLFPILLVSRGGSHGSLSFRTMSCTSERERGQCPAPHAHGRIASLLVRRPPVPFLVFPLLSNRWMESKATGSKGKENITNSSIDYPPSFTMIPAKAPYHA